MKITNYPTRRRFSEEPFGSGCKTLMSGSENQSAINISSNYNILNTNCWVLFEKCISLKLQELSRKGREQEGLGCGVPVSAS